MNVGCSVVAKGRIVEASLATQGVEMAASHVQLLGTCDPKVKHIITVVYSTFMFAISASFNKMHPYTLTPLFNCCLISTEVPVQAG